MQSSVHATKERLNLAECYPLGDLNKPAQPNESVGWLTVTESDVSVSKKAKKLINQLKKVPPIYIYTPSCVPGIQ